MAVFCDCVSSNSKLSQTLFSKCDGSYGGRRISDRVLYNTKSSWANFMISSFAFLFVSNHNGVPRRLILGFLRPRYGEIFFAIFSGTNNLSGSPPRPPSGRGGRGGGGPPAYSNIK